MFSFLQEIIITDKILYSLEVAGIPPIKIIQRPGDIMVIPAGCAHQVNNLSSCIKIAVDFVSPQSLDCLLVLAEKKRERALIKHLEHLECDLEELNNIADEIQLANVIVKAALLL
jgi:ribosomal protein L16 Arg81 hydroxylase